MTTKVSSDREKRRTRVTIAWHLSDKRVTMDKKTGEEK